MLKRSTVKDYLFQICNREKKKKENHKKLKEIIKKRKELKNS